MYYVSRVEVVLFKVLTYVSIKYILVCIYHEYCPVPVCSPFPQLSE